MVGTIEHVHILNQTATKTVFGKHAFHNLDEEGVHTGLDVFVERFLHEDLSIGVTLTAGIAGVRKIFAVCPFFASENHFVGIDNDYVVAALHVGRIRRLILAAEDFSDLRAKTTKMLVGGVDEKPLLFNALSVGSQSFVT